MEDKQKKVLANYGFEVKSRYRTRGAWVLDTDQGLKLLREYGQLNRHFHFENRIKNHLYQKGMTRLDIVVKNKNGEPITELENGEKYVVTDWFYGEECDLRSKKGLHEAAKNLGQMHRALDGFEKESEDGDDSDVCLRFSKHNKELKRIYSYMRNKKRKNEFEIFAIDSFLAFYEQGALAEEMLLQSPYYKERQWGRRIVCHGDYNHHNVIFTSDGVATTNFGKACICPPLIDVYYFIRKAMEKNNWDVQKGVIILDGYKEVCGLSKGEIEFLYIQLLFPEKFWKLMNQYYNRKKAWMSQRNMEKLIGVKEQSEARKKFLEFLKIY